MDKKLETALNDLQQRVEHPPYRYRSPCQHCDETRGRLVRQSAYCLNGHFQQPDDAWWARTLTEAIERVKDSPYFGERERQETLTKLENELRLVKWRIERARSFQLAGK